MCVYQELEAKVLPLMQHYQTDLTKHDKALLEQQPNVPFLHWACDSSTFLMLMIDASEYPKAGEVVPYLFSSADRWHLVNEAVNMASYFVRATNNPERFTVHYYDGKQLSEINVEKALELARQYKERVTKGWRAEDVRVTGYCFN
jgi:hypothetical protein